jgi:ligand-binding sensor domain-containing protein
VILVILAGCDDVVVPEQWQYAVVAPRDNQFTVGEAIQFEAAFVASGEAVDPSITWRDLDSDWTGHGVHPDPLPSDAIGLHRIRTSATLPAGGGSSLSEGLALRLWIRDEPPASVNLALWSADDGVPDGPESTIGRDDAGRMVVATPEGVARVGADGVEVLDRDDGLAPGPILAAVPDGDVVWVGHDARRDGGAPLERVTIDADGNVSIDAYAPFGLWTVTAFVPDDEVVWIGTGEGLYVWVRATATLEGPLGSPDLRAVITRSPTGGVYLGTSNGIAAATWTGRGADIVPIVTIDGWVMTLMTTDDGVIWAADFDGRLWSVDGSSGRPAVTAVTDFRELPPVLSVARVGDRVMLGTIEGLFEIREDGSLVQHGLAWMPGPDVDAMVVEGDAVWLGTGDGLARWVPER